MSHHHWNDRRAFLNNRDTIYFHRHLRLAPKEFVDSHYDTLERAGTGRKKIEPDGSFLKDRRYMPLP